MARTKNKFLNAKPVTKAGGNSNGVRNPAKPYKPPAKPSKPAKPAKPSKPAKPAKPSKPAKPAKPASNSRTAALKNHASAKPDARVNANNFLPNSKAKGINLPNAGANAVTGSTQGPNLKGTKPGTRPTPTASNARGLRGILGSGFGAIQAGMIAADLATQAGYARGGKNYKEFVRAQDRTPAKPAAKPAAKPGKPPLSSTGVRVSDKANQRDYNAAPTGSTQYNDYRNRQIAAERERLKNVGNPSKPKPKPPAPVADQRRSGGGNNTAPRSQTPPKPRFTGTVDEGRKMWAEKYSSSKYDGQAIQKEAKKLLEKMKQRKEDKSNSQRAGWDGNKNY